MLQGDARGPVRRERHVIVVHVRIKTRIRRIQTEVLELVVLGIQPAQLCAQRGGLAQQRAAFQLDALDVELGRVQHREGAHVLRHTRLEIAVVAVERRRAATETTISRTALQAQLVGPHVFRIELGMLRVVLGIGATIEATRLEATVGRHIRHQVVAEGLLQADRRRHCRPRSLGIKRHRLVQAGERCAPERAGGTVVILLVLGPAHAGSHGPGRREFPVKVGKRSGAGGGQVIFDGAQERNAVAEHREQIIGIGFLV
ncbi:hypothetical protein D3C71_862510 [compost metagenome]